MELSDFPFSTKNRPLRISYQPYHLPLEGVFFSMMKNYDTFAEWQALIHTAGFPGRSVKGIAAATVVFLKALCKWISSGKAYLPASKSCKAFALLHEKWTRTPWMSEFAANWNYCRIFMPA